MRSDRLQPAASTDQRGTPFVRSFVGDSDGTVEADIGAIELQTLESFSPVVIDEGMSHVSCVVGKQSFPFFLNEFTRKRKVPQYVNSSLRVRMTTAKTKVGENTFKKKSEQGEGFVSQHRKACTARVAAFTSAYRNIVWRSSCNLFGCFIHATNSLSKALSPVEGGST